MFMYNHYHSNDSTDSDDTDTDSDSTCSNDNNYLDDFFSTNYYSNDKHSVENIEDAFKESEEVIQHEICFLMDGYSYFTFDFMFIMRCSYSLNAWPGFAIEDINPETDYKTINAYNSNYNRLIKSKMDCPQVIIALITNSFCDSNEYVELLKHAKSLNKPVIGLILEKVENYENLVGDLDYSFEIYKERVSEIGYDQYLWISNAFNELIKALQKILNKVLERLVALNYEGYVLHMFHTIHNRNSKDIILKFHEKFEKLKGRIENFHINLFCERNYSDYVDLSQLNVGKILDREYLREKIYDHVDATLERLHILNKKDYLNILQCLDHLIDDKLNDLMSGKEVLNVEIKCPIYPYENVIGRIRLKMKHNGYFKDPFPIVKEKEDCLILYSIYKHVKEEFKKVDGMKLKFVNKIVGFLKDLYCKNDEPDPVFRVLNASVIIIAVFKGFYESGKFEKILKNFILAEKPIFIVKFEDFEIHSNAFKNAERVGLMKGVYDLWKHKEFDYDGYELRRLFSDLKKANFQLPFHNFLYEEEKYDCFICTNRFNDYEMCRMVELEARLKVEHTYMKIVNKSSISKIENEKYETFDLIERSRIVIFVLTNEYFTSEQFKNEYEHAKQFKKVIIYVLLEEITQNGPISIDFKQLNTVKLFRFDKSGVNLWKEELLYQITCLIFPVLDHGISYSVLKGEFTSKRIYSQSNKVVHGFNDKKSIYMKKMSSAKLLFDFIDNGHLLVFSRKLLYIFDRKYLNIVQKISIEDLDEEKFEGVCYMKHLKNLCMITKNVIYTMDEAYSGYTKIKILSKNHIMKFIEYSETRKMNYIYDDGMKMTIIYDCMADILSDKKEMTHGNSQVKSMKIINDQIYYLSDNCIFAYDLDVKPIAKFGYFYGYADFLMTSNKRLKDFLLVCRSNTVKIYNLNSFKLCCEVRKRSQYYQDEIYQATIIDDHMLILELDRLEKAEILYNNNINDCSSISKMNEMFICKLDTYNKHLLCNPYQLPCGNLACLGCIYKNYNIYTNEFKCRFESCQSEHCELGDILVKSDIVKVSLKSIVINFIKYSQELPSKNQLINEKTDSINNYFDMIENNMDIRYESLIAIIDDLQFETMMEVDELEHVLLNRSKRNNETNVQPGSINDNLPDIFKYFPIKSLLDINQSKFGSLGILEKTIEK